MLGEGRLLAGGGSLHVPSMLAYQVPGWLQGPRTMSGAETSWPRFQAQEHRNKKKVAGLVSGPRILVPSS